MDKAFLTDLYKETLTDLTLPRKWQGFLETSGRNFRLSFDEQVLLFAQKPEATAILEIERWNRNFGRWVNKGAKGIAFFGDNGKLKYCFDISDTSPSEKAKSVPIWEVKREYRDKIVAALEEYFGELPDKSDFGSALISAVKLASKDIISDYLNELRYRVKDSFLEDLDEYNTKIALRDAVQNSAAYMILTRCGVGTERFFEDEDFICVRNFSTAQTLNLLGTAVNDTARSCLDVIAKTSLNLQRQAEKENHTFEKAQNKEYDFIVLDDERSENYEHNLQPSGRLPASEPDFTAGRTTDTREIRIAPKEVFEGAEKSPLHGFDNNGQTLAAPFGDRENGSGPNGFADTAVDEIRGSDRNPKGAGPNEMGGTDEQHQTPSGGNSHTRDNLQLINKAEVNASAFSISEEDIASVLQISSLFTEGKFRIYRQFQRLQSSKENIEFLRKEYGIGGCTHYFPDGARGWAAHDGKGIGIEKRSDDSETKLQLSWAEAEKRIKELIQRDNYLTAEETAKYQEYIAGLDEEPATLFDLAQSTVEHEDEISSQNEETIVLKEETPVLKAEKIDFHITDDRLGEATPSMKYAYNIAAIRWLKKIEDEGRLATPEEQEILSKYVGWGGLADCFDEQNPKCAELKELLTEEEFAAARASSLTAFYTSPTIIKAMYSAIGKMGFKSGNILEPSCGIGNFMGLLPEEMGKSKFYGVELDEISGRIAKQLYQNSTINITGYENAELPDSFFDVAVGNVPFGDFKVSDKRYDKNNWLIHDYFFGKTLDKVRPGGIVAFITSKGTLDKENPSVRKYIAQRAELIGAIRLPNNAFKANAGTEVTSDIIFLQKRDRIIDIEPDWVHLDTDENGIKMNSYFVSHPEMILGKMEMVSSRFGMESTCKPTGEDLGELLQNAVSNLSAEITEYELPEAEEDNSIPADPTVRNFSFTLLDGKIYYRENSRMYEMNLSETAAARVKGMIEIRESVRKVIELQTEDYSDEDIKAEQQKLNKLYDNYTKNYGLLTSRGNKSAFGDDASYYLLCSLEILDEEGKFKRKADMFTKRTIKPHVAVKSVDTAAEALAVSVSEKAGVDMGYMENLSGKTSAELETELRGVIYRNIICGEKPEDVAPSALNLSNYPFVTADEYLSGNVRKKLRMVKSLCKVLPAEEKSKIEHCIKSLEAVQPQDLTAGEIGVRIGVNWVPTEIYEQFMYELLGTSYYLKSRIKILYSKTTGEWNISNKSIDGGNIKAVATYGTKRINAYHILEQTLNQKEVRVYDRVIDENGKEKPILNKKETAIAQDRQELIKSKFAEWIWEDIDRREKLCSIYNETFNAIRPREYDGSHIRFSGMNPEIALRPHQVNAVAHIIYGGNTLLAHEVGAGKTFEMVAAAMEMKRLGLCTKSLVVVPNHITEQWAAEWLQLYPSANILVATKKDFETANRKKFCARIATGEYDAVIIGHSQFEKIPISSERQEAILKEQIEGIVEGIREAKRSRAENYTVKQMEKTKKALEAKLKKLNDQSRKDSVVNFEELGIDRVFVDESHYFKNLFLATKMRNVGGIAQTEAQKSSDLFAKCRYLDEITGGRGVIFATGTPISNSMVELYTVQRYLQYETLSEMNLLNFDDWAATYGETVTAIELSPEGSGYRSKTRFAKFYNLPELMSIFKTAADIQTADMLKLPVPKANFHTVVIKPSELQKDMIAGLAERAEQVRAGAVDPSVDNMLKITNDGRKLALDMRLINPLSPDDEHGKVAVCAQNIFDIWDKTKNEHGAQMVFCDLSTPKGDGSFNVYDDLKSKLTAKGIPEDEIAFIHNANPEARKKELFAKVRSGQIRVLMGSTQKMGAGTNCQDKLIALHDLDCPWRPSDLAQRLGRIVRQGNENKEVEIFRYVTENTFDAYLYQLVENKQKFIAQIMTSKTPARVADDVDETALSYSEIKALATGNPLIIEKCSLDTEVAKLNVLKANHLNQKYSLEALVLRKYPSDIAKLAEQISNYEKDIAVAKANSKPTEGFVGMTVGDKTYYEKEKAGKAILTACSSLKSKDSIAIGKYRGFAISLSYDNFSGEYRITLKANLSHSTALGTDVFGNIIRIDNLIESLEQKLEATKAALAETQIQLQNAKAEMSKPFAKEDELAEKTRRLKELNILLNLEQKDRVVMEEGEEVECREKDREVER